MMDNMEMWIQKADVLIEALPYIREFSGKKIVVKYVMFKCLILISLIILEYII